MLYRLIIITESKGNTIESCEEVYINPENVLLAKLGEMYRKSKSRGIKIKSSKDDLSIVLMFSENIKLNTTLGEWKAMMNEISWNRKLQFLK